MPKGRPVLPVVDLEDGDPETPEPAAPVSRPHANALTVRQLQVQEKDLERASSTDSNHPLLTPPFKEGRALVAEDSSTIQVCASMHRPTSCWHISWRGYQELVPPEAASISCGQPVLSFWCAACRAASLLLPGSRQVGGRGAAGRAAATD